MDEFSVKDGDIIEFKGCVWNDGWEFEAPVIIYSPVQRYSSAGSIFEESIYDCIENICIDLVTSDKVRKNFSEFENQEFKWHGWSIKGFAKRKRAIHATVKMRFFLDKKGNLTFEEV